MSKRFPATATVGLMLSVGAPTFAQVATIDDITIVSNPPTNRDAFGPGEEIRVYVVFSEPVAVTGNPLLDLRIGDRIRRADLYAVDDARLSFRYFVKAADLDSDGIGIPADAVRLDSGSIRDAAGHDADLTHEAVPDDPRFKVDGRSDTAPTITNMSLGRTTFEETVVRGAPILVLVWFSERVEVTGKPQISIQVGTRIRQAELHRRVGAAELEFQYVVQAADVDADGVGIPADALILNGGSITDADGNDADLTHDARPDIPHVKVNGAVGRVPFVTRAEFLREPAASGTYAAGETIFTQVRFSRPVRVTGAPQFTVQVGTQARQADHLPALRAAESLPPGNGFHEPGDGWVVFFRYVVQPSDIDDDGISAPASALTLNGGSIRAVGDDTDARLGHVALADDPARKVDGSRGDDQAPTVDAAYVLDLPIRGVFGGGDTITVVLGLSEGVTLTGAPRFGLRIGGQTRFATFRERWGSTSLLFDYVVKESDRDDDGLSIAADAVDLNGATIRDNAGNDADLDLGYRAFDDDPRYRVDGRLTAVPALPWAGALALLVALLAGGWRRLVRAGALSAE